MAYGTDFNQLRQLSAYQYKISVQKVDYNELNNVLGKGKY
jgi:hypothetical protein